MRTKSTHNPPAPTGLTHSLFANMQASRPNGPPTGFVAFKPTQSINTTTAPTRPFIPSRKPTASRISSATCKTHIPRHKRPDDALQREAHRLRRELQESPHSKRLFNQFSADVKQLEPLGLQPTVHKVLCRIFELPRKVHWRVLLDLADFAKREGKFGDARVLYKIVTRIQPYAYQGWLEFAKMEEELGRTHKCVDLLSAGLSISNQLNENLFLKKMKVEEKLGQVDQVRKTLSMLRNVNLE